MSWALSSLSPGETISPRWEKLESRNNRHRGREVGLNLVVIQLSAKLPAVTETSASKRFTDRWVKSGALSMLSPGVKIPQGVEKGKAKENRHRVSKVKLKAVAKKLSALLPFPISLSESDHSSTKCRLKIGRLVPIEVRIDILQPRMYWNPQTMLRASLFWLGQKKRSEYLSSYPDVS